MTYPPFGGTKEMKIHNGLHKAVEKFQISMKSLVYKYGHPLFKGCEKKKRISLAGPFTLILTAVFLQKVKLNGNKILLHLI